MKPSADPIPRPPATTTEASARSGRPVFVFGLRRTTRALLAAALTSTSTGSTTGSAGWTSGATALGRTVMIGVPLTTWLWTIQVPARTDCVTTGPPSPEVTSTALVTIPESRRTAARAAISVPSAPAVTSTAAGDVRRTTVTRASAFGATR